MLQVRAQFHPLYGFSWIVEDINPEYSLGDMMRHRQEILRILKEEGVIDLNKQIPLPVFAQRIAVVSSETAAGYGDFKNQLEHNERGLKFATRLPATMQGETVEASVIEALNAIFDEADHFDVVVIIRGGGAGGGPERFRLAGAGRERSQLPSAHHHGYRPRARRKRHRLRLAHTGEDADGSCRLPIDHLETTYDKVMSAQDFVAHYAKERMTTEKQRLHTLSSTITSLFSVVKVRQEARLAHLGDRLTHSVEQRLKDERHQLSLLATNLQPPLERRLMKERHHLDLLEQKARALDPRLLLKRGYSLTLHEGKVVKDAKQLRPGDLIETHLAQGRIRSQSGGIAPQAAKTYAY